MDNNYQKNVLNIITDNKKLEKLDSFEYFCNLGRTVNWNGSCTEEIRNIIMV